MTGFLAALAVAAACIGAGAALLALTGVLESLPRGERLAWSFAAGLGAVGWLVFFPALAGLIAPVHMGALCAAAAGGWYFLFRSGFVPDSAAPLDATGWLLFAALFVVMAFDVLEGVSPPLDGDSLAYHFALPKQFLAAGQLEFVPRAADGAAPLLLHMTYLIALGLGGEAGLTLWAMMSGWMAGLMVFAVGRRFLDFNTALAVTVIFLTTPAVLFGAGAGQVETRLAMLVLAAVFAAAQSFRRNELRHAALAGLMAGFYAASKFTGLGFVAVCGAALLIHRRWLARGAVFGVAALLAGGQWYAWNAYNTGDPLFPMLFTLLGLPDSEIWNARQAAHFAAGYFGTEAPVPRTVIEFLAYPFRATLFGPAAYESGRTGFGPYLLLTLPFVALGIWQGRRRIAASRLALPALIVAAVYALWFFSGSSQRVRHLLPLYPVLLIAATAAARHWVSDRHALAPFVAAVALTLAVQFGAGAVFAANYARHVFTGESREALLRRTVSRYAPIAWINRNLETRHKVLLTERQLVYLADVPVFYAHPQMAAQIEIRPDSTDPSLFLRQLRRHGVTHILAGDETPSQREVSAHEALTAALVRAGCARPLKVFEMEAISSRTLPTLNASRSRLTLFEIQPGNCPL